MSLLSTSAARRFLAIALIALGLSIVAMHGAETANSIDAKAAAATTAAKEKAKKATSITELRKLHEEATKQRDTMIAEFEKLAKEMKEATEEKKKEIREKLEAQKKKFEEVTNALHKQIRDEQRKQRQNAAPKR